MLLYITSSLHNSLLVDSDTPDEAHYWCKLRRRMEFLRKQHQHYTSCF